MEKRNSQLQELKTYIHNVDKEMTLILQSLQWDQSKLLENRDLVQCKYDLNHKMPSDRKELHEAKCFLKSQGYYEKDKLLIEPLHMTAPNIIKFSAEQIKKIIYEASMKDSTFKRGDGCEDPLPLTVERLQSTYTADERRAIYDAVIHTVPSTQDLIDLTLPGNNGSQRGERLKSQLELAAELRDMKRRRTKYRVAPKTKNYSMVLRDVIKTQMELYTEAQAEIAEKVKKEDHKEFDRHRKTNCSDNTSFQDKQKYNCKRSARDRSTDRHCTKNRKNDEHMRIRETFSQSHTVDREKKKERYEKHSNSRYDKYRRDRHQHERHRQSYSSTSRHREMEHKRYYDIEHISSSDERKNGKKLE